MQASIFPNFWNQENKIFADYLKIISNFRSLLKMLGKFSLQLKFLHKALVSLAISSKALDYKKNCTLLTPCIFSTQYWVLGGEARCFCGLTSHDTEVYPTKWDLNFRCKTGLSYPDWVLFHYCEAKRLKTFFSKSSPIIQRVVEKGRISAV